MNAKLQIIQVSSYLNVYQLLIAVFYFTLFKLKIDYFRQAIFASPIQIKQSIA